MSSDWRVGSRLTLNLGARVEHYVDGWPEQQFAPNGHPQLANWTDPVYRAFVAPRTVQAPDMVERVDRERLAGLRAGDQVVEVPQRVLGPDVSDEHEDLHFSSSLARPAGGRRRTFG